MIHDVEIGGGHYNIENCFSDAMYLNNVIFRVMYLNNALMRYT